MKQIKKGFSMIELIIVIAVLGVLTAVVLNQAQGMRESSNLNRESSNLGMLTTAIQSTFNSQGNYDGVQNNIIKSSTSFPSAMDDGLAPTPGENNNGDSNNKIKTVWADAGVDIAPESFNSQANAAFSITYKSIPESSCVDFASQNYSSFFRMDIGTVTIVDKDPATTDPGYQISKVVTECAKFPSAGGEITFYSR